jgi:hypothetical protein
MIRRNARSRCGSGHLPVQEWQGTLKAGAFSSIHQSPLKYCIVRQVVWGGPGAFKGGTALHNAYDYRRPRTSGSLLPSA